MRRVHLAVAVLVGAALGVPSTAIAQQEIKLHPKAPVTVTEGAPITAKIKPHEIPAALTLVCIDFQFEGDLLDPGETLIVDLGPSLGAFGSINFGDTSLPSQSVCTAQSEHLAAFFDGRERVQVAIEAGSATVTSASLRMLSS